MYIKFIKPTIDFIGALTIFILCLPVFILVGSSLLIANKGDVFFLQERIGKDRRIFRIIKFKTMNDSKGEQGILLPDEKRLTTIGKFFRKTSFDEIPQLLCIIKGDMSLIGPRPLLVEYLPLYNKEQQRRHEVRPGITGLAQISGRNAISWEEKFKYDVLYVDHSSFRLDIKIIFLTILKILKSDGINAKGAATMPPFEGTKHCDHKR